MLANNKIHFDTDRDRPVHDISSQRHGRPSYDPTEYPYDRPTHHQTYSRYAKYERPRGYEQAQEQEQEELEQLDHLYYRRGHPNQLVDDEEPQQRSMNSIPSMAIHPTIANLVTPKSARSTQHSPPSPPLPSPPLHRLPSFSRRSFSPASSSSSCSSLSPRNVPISPEPESERRLQQDYHHHHYYYNHRHHYYKDQMTDKSSDPFHDRGLPYHDHENRQSFDSARTSSPSSRAQRGGSQDRDMEVDTGVGAGAKYAYKELSSDVMMDQCEPQRDWSSTLSQRTNSPSPVMSCTMYPLAPPSRKQSSYLHHQELPPLLPQPICDQHERCSSPPMHRQEHFHSEAHQYQHHGPHHPYQDSYPSHYHQRRHSLRTAPISSWSDANTGVGLTSSSSSSSAAVPLFRSKTASAMRTFPSWRSRTRPFSVPNYPSADFLQQPHSSTEGLPSMQSSALQMPATVAQTKQEGPLSRPLTPPSRETWCNDQQQQQKLSQQQQQSTARGTLPSTTSTTANPPSWRKSFEHVSEAQRVLYERHPPSPKKYDRVSTCASSSSTSSSSCSALPSSSSSSSAELSTSSSSSVSPPSAPPSPPSPSHIPHTPVAGSPVLSSSFEQGFNAPPRPLTRFPSPVPSNRLPQSNLSQQQHQQQQQHQKRYEFKHCSFQSPEPASTLSSQQPDEENHETGLIARKSLANSANSANPPAGPKVPLILPKAVVSESPVPPLPGTEGLKVLRNEEGAIVVFNQVTDTMTFRCELCPTESFGRIHDLKRHQTSKHQEMTWPCDFCHRPFVRRDALLRHYTVKAARDDGLHPASHEVEKLRAARARAKVLS